MYFELLELPGVSLKTDKKEEKYKFEINLHNIIFIIN